MRDERAIGQLSLCPKCGSMVMITPPSPAGEPVKPSSTGEPAKHQSDSAIYARQAGGPSGSSPQMVVGGGALGPDFDDAAALLADTMDDVAPPKTEPLPSDKAQPRAVDERPHGAQQDAAALAAASVVSPPPSDMDHAPPPIETPTESMSSIELDPGAAGGASPLAQAGAATAREATKLQAQANQARSPAHVEASAGAAMPPPVAQTPWVTPAQLAWQRYGMIGAGVLAAIVMVGGLLVFLLRGPAAEPVAEVLPPADIEPIPDADQGPDAIAPASGNAVDDTEEPAAGDDAPPVDERTPDDLNIDHPSPPTDGSDSDTPGTPESPIDKRPTDAPPLFVEDGPIDGVDNPLDEPTADTGLGELAPLIDAFPLPPVSPKTPREGEPSDIPAPIPTETVSRPRPDPVSVNVSDRLADEIAGFDTGGAPLVKVIELIMQVSTIPITISPDALAQRKLRPDTPVSVDLRNSSVDEILQAVLKGYELAYEIRGDQIAIVSAASQGDLRTVNHAVDDMISGEDDVQSLAEQLQSLIAPQSWKAAGGEGTLSSSPTTIAIKNNFDVQFHTHVFLQKLRVARGHSPRSTFSEVMFDSTSRTQRAAKKLQTPVRAVFHVEQPLVRVLGHLEKAASMTFLVDWETLGEAGWPPSSDAVVVADDVPLAEALDQLLGPMDLAYRAIDETTIQITSLKALTTEAELELYPIAQALAAKKITADALISELKNELGAGLFAESGGPFEIHYDAPSNCILVRLPQAQQRVAEAWLSTAALAP